MPTKDTGSGSGGRRPTGNTGRNRNAYCSFCRKSYRDVGPLVEGPGDVYICGECADLTQDVLKQEIGWLKNVTGGYAAGLYVVGATLAVSAAVTLMLSRKAAQQPVEAIAGCRQHRRGGCRLLHHRSRYRNALGAPDMGHLVDLG